MCHRFLTFVLALSSLCGVAGHVGRADANDEILSDRASFAAQIEAHLRRDDDVQPAALQAVKRLVTPSSQWRFHPRGRGVLIAIPVRRSVLVQEKSSGEAAVRDIVERMIRQRGLTTPIEVVFVEPTPPPRPVQVVIPCETACEPAPCRCECR